jgi:hypothetical protein
VLVLYRLFRPRCLRFDTAHAAADPRPLRMVCDDDLYRCCRRLAGGFGQRQTCEHFKCPVHRFLFAAASQRDGRGRQGQTYFPGQSSRHIAGASGFVTLIHSRDGPDRWKIIVAP